jgi:hypothetical protein
VTKLDIDVTSFERDLFAFERDLRDELVGVAADLAEQAEQDARSRLDLLIYSQPERGYERTGALRDSVQGSASVTLEGFSVDLSAFGGAGGRLYAEYNERGTYGSRISLDRILEEARASGYPLQLPAYPRGRGGLEARPFVSNAIAAAEDALEPFVLEAVDRAWR